MAAESHLCCVDCNHRHLTILHLYWSTTPHLPFTVHNNSLSAPFSLSRFREEWKQAAEEKKQSSNLLWSLMFVIDIWGRKRQIALNSNRGLLWTTHSKDTLSTEHNWAIKFKTLDALSTLCVIYNRIVLVCTAASIFMYYFSTQINFCRYERCEETGKRVLLFFSWSIFLPCRNPWILCIVFVL